MGLPLRDTQRHTYGEYLTWPEDVRYELIAGEAYLMAPAPSPTHQRLILELGRQIADALEGRRCEVFLAPFDVRLPLGDEADWVIEVLSPATAAHDQTVKLAAYERAGVRECWFVHPTDRTVMVYRLDGAAYGRPALTELQGVLAAQAVADVSIDWARALRDRKSVV